MKNLQSPILRGLLNNQKTDKYRFHMPGHKGKLLEIYKPIMDNLLSFDFTEIDGTDDLYNSNKFIKEALELLSIERKSQKSFFLTNGSTVGILASILALTNFGDNILIEKECHKSVYNAIELNSLNPIILKNEIKPTGLTIPIGENLVLNSLKKSSSIKMVVLTRPNYYGLCCKIDEISKYCLENGIYLLIDEAHGSHFPYSDKLPKTAMELGASISVNSFHKTLPALTQCSVLNLGNNLTSFECSKILNMIGKLQTSSPSYLLMASIDICRTYVEENGVEKLKELENNISNFYKSIEHLDYIKKISIPENSEMDFTRIILETEIPAINIQKLLEKHDVYIEMISNNLLVLISSMEDEKKDFQYLAKVLLTNKIPIESQNNIQLENNTSIINFNDGQFVPLNECIGKILKENIIIYPPGSIYLKIGDIITKENIDYILKMISSGVNVYTDFNKNIELIYVAID